MSYYSNGNGQMWIEIKVSPHKNHYIIEFICQNGLKNCCYELLNYKLVY